ncbi:MAG: endonuclease/exonuclease/phosphatase family protein [Candidatus Hydrogenedentes bacterium]|nr:endonuclease/exonuclease/phosphatase family protein [Candidatus Hydrogenedentota bacterium]
MLRTVVCIACVLCCFGARAEMDLKVMSFNVRYGTALDGENAWAKRKDILINAIRNQSPDIIGVQECLVFQAEYIAGQLPEYRWMGVDRDVTGKGEMTAVFYKGEMLFPLESGHFWLSETPDVPASKSWDTSLTRMATWLLFYHPPTQTRFYFYNTHLDHRGEEARAQGVSVIANHVKARHGGYPVILTGDFNAYAQNSRPYEVAMQHGFTDAWTSAEKCVGPTVTFSSFSDPDPAVDRRIDWILYQGTVRVSACETDIYSENGRYPSDHFPVVAVIHIGNK